MTKEEHVEQAERMLEDATRGLAEAESWADAADTAAEADRVWNSALDRESPKIQLALVHATLAVAKGAGS